MLSLKSTFPYSPSTLLLFKTIQCTSSDVRGWRGALVRTLGGVRTRTWVWSPHSCKKARCRAGTWCLDWGTENKRTSWGWWPANPTEPASLRVCDSVSGNTVESNLGKHPTLISGFYMHVQTCTPTSEFHTCTHTATGYMPTCMDMHTSPTQSYIVEITAWVA